MVLGALHNYMPKNETQPPTYTIHKNNLKMDKRLKWKLQQHQGPRGEHRQEISDIPCSNIFTDLSPRARDKKERINKSDFIKILCFLYCKNIIINQ